MPDCIPPPPAAPKTDSWRARAAGNWKWWVGLLAPFALAGLAFGVTAIVQATEMRASIAANGKDVARNETAISKAAEEAKATRAMIGDMQLDVAIIKEAVGQIKESLREQPRRRR